MTTPIETIKKIEALRDEAKKYVTPTDSAWLLGQIEAYNTCLSLLKEMRIKGEGKG